jgi:hypothetical protein
MPDFDPAPPSYPSKRAKNGFSLVKEHGKRRERTLDVLSLVVYRQPTTVLKRILALPRFTHNGRFFA